ncbi:hypothetical protein SLEP1_g25580 [Rubroshorea leprosula]|uniref:Uncharacterized protein n=1 Tax=Rubroshorea leprosula TaxID=152421 RepID=A0AAV5JQK7_9ROSI|nr:hypothetical protein SLEP1_g25580 [Rubroshorea leprosula]
MHGAVAEDFRERTSEKKSKRQPAESLEASLRQSLRRFCVSDSRRKGSHWDTSIQNKGTSATVKATDLSPTNWVFGLLNLFFSLFRYGTVVHQFNLRFDNVWYELILPSKATM